MSGFIAYCAYVSLHNHFNQKHYDYFKYSGKTTITPESFEKRNDKIKFNKIAKHPDFERIILANLVSGPSDYIGDIASKKGMDIYLSWLKRIESLEYMFKNDLTVIEGSIVDSFRVYNGQHPRLLRLLLSDKISLESFMILADLGRFITKWNEQISDPIIWPAHYTKCRKYRGFLEYNRERMKQILLDELKERD